MPFRFKKFNIEDDRSTMKVGTDAVLLASWVNISEVSHILDIGTGSGIIALILAQRSDALIDGIDIDAESIEQAVENAENSPWPEQLRFVLSSLQDFTKVSNEKYDLIVTNPPYFSNSLKSPSLQKNMARHATKTEHSEWILSIQKLLSPSGKLGMVLPYTEWDSFLKDATIQGMHCHQVLKVSTKPGKGISRVLSEWGRKEGKFHEEALLISDMDGKYTDAYKALTHDFYLNF